MPGLPIRSDLTALTVALSGRVLALERSDEEVLWRAERQTVVRIDQPARSDRMEEVLGKRRHPDDPDGRLAVLPAVTPHNSGANAAERARLLSGPGDVPRRRRLVCGVQHIRALAGISGPGLARAVPTGGATLPPAGLFAAQIRTGRLWTDRSRDHAASPERVIGVLKGLATVRPTRSVTFRDS